MYIPSAPWCEKNAAYGAACGQAFLAGAARATSPPRTTRSTGGGDGPPSTTSPRSDDASSGSETAEPAEPFQDMVITWMA